MRETLDLVREWRDLASDAKAVLATVVSTSGSTYRRAGARMLLFEGKVLAGTVSGGCVEADLLESCWQRTSKGPVTVTYDASSDDDIIWGFGLGCNGIVRVLLERLDTASTVLETLEATISTRQESRIATVLEGTEIGKHWIHQQAAAQGNTGGQAVEAALAQLETGAKRLSTIDGCEMLLEWIVPPLHLCIVGTGPDAAALGEAARLLGWHIEQIDLIAVQGEAFAAGLTSAAAAVAMNHNYRLDQHALTSLLSSRVGYIGMLGPRRRTERMLSELNRDWEPRVHGPAGLDLGAEGPEQIALAIVAEIQAFFAGTAAGFLTHRHEREALCSPLA